jgi:fucose permease
VLAAYAAGYVVAGLLAGRLIARLGTGGVVAASLAATAAAALGQASAPPWTAFVALAAVSGLGGGAVDTALNAFAAARFAPRHLNWMHGSWGIGATLGPAAATAMLAYGAGWQAGYAVVGATLAALSGAFLLTRARWDAAAAVPEGPRGSARAALRSRLVWLQMAVFFVYTGLEAGAGQWAATVLAARGATAAEGAAAAALFWAGLAAARFAMGFVVDRLGPDRLLRLAMPAVVAAAAVFALGVADRAALLVLAAMLAPIFPTVMARTPARLGPLAVHAIGFQISAAMIGVAVLPGAMGLVADLFGAGAVPLVVLALSVVLTLLIWRLTARR